MLVLRGEPVSKLVQPGAPDDDGTGGFEPAHHGRRLVGNDRCESRSVRCRDPLLVDEVFEPDGHSGQRTWILPLFDPAVDHGCSFHSPVAIDRGEGVECRLRLLGAVDGGGDDGAGAGLAGSDR